MRGYVGMSNSWKCVLSSFFTDLTYCRVQPTRRYDYWSSDFKLENQDFVLCSFFFSELVTFDSSAVSFLSFLPFTFGFIYRYFFFFTFIVTHVRNKKITLIRIFDVCKLLSLKQTQTIQTGRLRSSSRNPVLLHITSRCKVNLFIN